MVSSSIRYISSIFLDNPVVAPDVNGELISKDERALSLRQGPSANHGSSAIRVSWHPVARELEPKRFFVRNLPVS